MNCFTHTLPPLQSYSPLSARFKEFPELFLESEGLHPFGCWTHFSSCLQDLGGQPWYNPTGFTSHVLRSFNSTVPISGLACGYHPAPGRESRSHFSGAKLPAADRFRERFVCVCVLWFVPSNHWMLYMFCMRRIAFVTYSCVAEQFKLHRDVYLYTVFGCIHASLQQFSLCFSNVMCEWGYIGRFTGTCLYIVCNVYIYIAKVVSSIHRNNFILLTITWLVVIYKNRQYIRVHVTHVAE